MYIGTGQDPEHSTGIAYLWCIDLTKAVERGAAGKDRDVSPERVEKVKKLPNGDEEVRTKANPASALAWSYGGQENRRRAPRDFKFGRTLSTVCVVDDIVDAAEVAGYVHCLNAKTGTHYCSTTPSRRSGAPPTTRTTGFCSRPRAATCSPSVTRRRTRCTTRSWSVRTPRT